MYLTEKMNIASDHVHEDAEAIEHIITPELKKDWQRCWTIRKRIHTIKRSHGNE